MILLLTVSRCWYLAVLPERTDDAEVEEHELLNMPPVRAVLTSEHAFTHISFIVLMFLVNTALRFTSKESIGLLTGYSV